LRANLAVPEPASGGQRDDAGKRGAEILYAIKNSSRLGCLTVTHPGADRMAGRSWPSAVVEIADKADLCVLEAEPGLVPVFHSDSHDRMIQNDNANEKREPRQYSGMSGDKDPTR
jgi:hypothetical protein